jgi:hypothetical protein
MDTSDGGTNHFAWREYSGSNSTSPDAGVNAPGGHDAGQNSAVQDFVDPNFASEIDADIADTNESYGEDTMEEEFSVRERCAQAPLLTEREEETLAFTRNEGEYFYRIPPPQEDQVLELHLNLFTSSPANKGVKPKAKIYNLQGNLIDEWLFDFEGDDFQEYFFCNTNTQEAHCLELAASDGENVGTTSDIGYELELHFHGINHCSPSR